ncbi:hypothetical protein HB364_17560 [Pseudoflavitalea sp. X16]|uniref:hypothetical protein n=1 Tax=Paraflavitalea devenefica TaxID=2716334 RepID=UPI00141FE535|nr:hypothetical protein [Paraflavitalea devenefica]NII26901.1 hypothetical protein [Paraflavitalea devenefica]
MKKVFLLATMVIALTGLTMAQATPKQAKEPAKKEATAPARDVAKTDKKETKKAAGAHHHKKHTKQAKQS